MKAKDNVRVYVMKVGRDDFHVRLSIPGQIVKELVVKGTLHEVEAAILDELVDLDLPTSTKVIEALGLKAQVYDADKDINFTDDIHIAYNHGQPGKPLQTWCGGSGESFMFMCIDTAIDAANMDDRFVLCSYCVDIVFENLSQLTKRNRGEI